MSLDATANEGACFDGQAAYVHALFWAELRRQAGRLRFCRNYPTGPYVQDFYCLSARLAVIIDNGLVRDGASLDARAGWLSAANIESIRVPAATICDDVASIVATVLQRARARTPHGDPAATA